MKNPEALDQILAVRHASARNSISNYAELITEEFPASDERGHAIEAVALAFDAIDAANAKLEESRKQLDRARNWLKKAPRKAEG